MEIRTMSIPFSKIIALLGAGIPLLKKKKFVVLYQRLDGRWTQQAGPYSKRQCRKEIESLVAIGMNRDRFKIVRDKTKIP